MKPPSDYSSDLQGVARMAWERHRICLYEATQSRLKEDEEDATFMGGHFVAYGHIVELVCGHHVSHPAAMEAMRQLFGDEDWDPNTCIKCEEPIAWDESDLYCESCSGEKS